MYAPENLHRWTVDGPTGFDSAANYMGEDLSEYYVAPVSFSRDADVLTRANWDTACNLLRPLGAEIARFGHWACGWYELLLIPADNEDCLREADELAASLEDYPVLDEEHYSALEWEEAMESWGFMSLRDRIELCAQAGVSIFAARRSDVVPDHWQIRSALLDG